VISVDAQTSSRDSNNNNNTVPLDLHDVLDVYSWQRLKCWHVFRSGASAIAYGCQARLEALLSHHGLQAAERGNGVEVPVQPRVFLDVYQPPHWHVSAADSWCVDARRCLNVPNAGGASVQSEVVAVQYFHDRWGGRKFLLEMEVEYIWQYKLCDFVATIRGHRVGISVTRAMQFPDVRSMTSEQATHLLRKKLTGLVIASAGVSERHGFSTSILHVLVASFDVGVTVYRAYEDLVREEEMQLDIDDEARIRDVIVIITVCPVLTDVIFATSKTRPKEPQMMHPFGPVVGADADSQTTCMSDSVVHIQPAVPLSAQTTKKQRKKKNTRKPFGSSRRKRQKRNS